MLNLGIYQEYIIAAYLVADIALAGLFLFVVFKYSAAKKKLKNAK